LSWRIAATVLLPYEYEGWKTLARSKLTPGMEAAAKAEALTEPIVPTKPKTNIFLHTIMKRSLC
jgi:hypothetical protein